MEKIKANVKEWERTHSIALAGDTMEPLSRYFSEVKNAETN